MIKRIRPRAATYLVAAATVAGMGVAVAGLTRVATAMLIAIVGFGVVLCLDTNVRLRRAERALRQSAERQRDIRRASSRILDRLGGLRSTARQNRVREDALTARVDARLEAMERRYLASFEAERLRAADRHREALGAAEPLHHIVDALDALPRNIVGVDGATVDERLQLMVRDLTNVVRGETGEVEALLQLVPRVQAPALLPSTGNWAMNARSLAHLVDIVGRERPRTLLELGSGTSTVWLAHILAGSGVRMVSIDHEQKYADATARQLEAHGVRDFVDLRVAPLVPLEVEGSPQVWYDPAAFAGLDQIDLLVVDGPPKASGALARWPALPVLGPLLSANSVIVLDDADRPDEVKALRRWMRADESLVRLDEGVSRLAVLRRAR